MGSNSNDKILAPKAQVCAWVDLELQAPEHASASWSSASKYHYPPSQYLRCNEDSHLDSKLQGR